MKITDNVDRVGKIDWELRNFHAKNIARTVEHLITPIGER